MKLLPIFLLPALFCTAAARADFAMLPAAPQAPASASSPASPADSGPAVSPAPAPTPIALHPATSTSGRQAGKISEHAALIAVGFGQQVPLSFAIRQIVPQSIKLRFSPSTDRQALVDWRGGRQWPAVLRDAIRPLGLRLTVHHHIAIISNPQKD